MLQGTADVFSSMPKKASASLGNSRQLTQLTEKVNSPSSRLAGGSVPQNRGKRFNQPLLKALFKFTVDKENYAPLTAGGASGG